ncbi:hypothetical protein GIB67_006854 [Kingdonia uniflora]|uniref:Uncharacterized protein n=1 Tax=Kingdonia uniflora TaxID=39325 RepID=A0A7J7L079_9MAGN|nr:hypothetical protein GIB67_006854 [Kingdonia uniflora]
MCFLVCLSAGLNVRAVDLGQIYDLNRIPTYYESNPLKGQTGCCSLVVYLMQIIIHCMAITEGIHEGL